MNPPYLLPANECRAEILVLNSRFIASLAPASSVEAARAFIQHIKAEFPDASHNVSAFVIGHGNSVTTHASDDGEPSGTAGRPALAILQGSGLGDAVVVVTRYFGGTRLGTGGLVRAYGAAVRAVLAVTPRAYKILTCTTMIALPYPVFERVRVLISAWRGQILEESFTTEVTLTARFAAPDLPPFQAALAELSAGSLVAECIESQENLMPIEP
jgi:uncharacterized YigZ family protein